MKLLIPVLGLVPLVIYLLRLSGEKLSTQLFSIENNLLIYAPQRELLVQAFSRFRNCSPFYIRTLKMDKIFREPKELVPITHKEFNEFIKGKSFTGRNNYKLKDLKRCLDLNL